MELIFQKSTKTIRQMPENYLLAHFDEMRGGRWVCDPDLACDRYLAYKVFKTLLDFDFKWCADGILIVEHVNNIGSIVEIATTEESLEIVFGRGCNCDMCTDELSRTLGELLDNEKVPVCPVCETRFEMVSIVNFVYRNKLLEFEINT